MLNVIEKSWKYYLGLGLFFYSFLPYLVSAMLFFLHIPVVELITIMGVFIASGELAFIASAMLLGKTIFEAVKSKFIRFFKPGAKPQITPVSKTRHYIGVIMFFLSALPYFITEICLFLDYPKTHADHIFLLLIMLSGDAVFIISLFVLGGEFWEKLKDLFTWNAESN